MKYTAETFKADYRGLLPSPNSKSEELRSLSDDEMRYFIYVCMVDPEKVDDSLLSSINCVPVSMILSSRLKHVEIQPDLKTKMFLGCIIKSAGSAVLWAFTIARLAFELKRSPTFDDLFLSSSSFGEGLPTEAKRSESWKNQKCESSNFVDRPELWPKWKEAK